MISIAVAIIFFQKLDQTISCIKSFIDSEVNLYVLNNGSNTKDFEKIKSEFIGVDNIKYFDVNQNLGPARGRNYLLDQISENWVVFADNDITVEPHNWVQLVKTKIEANKNVDVYLPRLFNVHENNYAKFSSFSILNNRIVDSASSKVDYTDLNWFPSGACVVKRTFFEEVGEFDCDLFAFEDYEMGIRCLVNNRRINIKPVHEITFVHDHKFQSKARDKSAVLERYNSQRLLNSAKRIESKYNLVFAHDWSYWTNTQIKLMTTRSGMWGAEGVRRLLKILYNVIPKA